MENSLSMTEVHHLWSGVLPADVVFDVSIIPAARLALPQSLASLQSCSESRQAEFNAGRVCAENAMSRLSSISRQPVIQGANGGPVWPDGLVGSITHVSDWACAAVARSQNYLSLGIDAAPLGVFRASGRSRIGDHEEWKLVASFEENVAGRLLFSMKEAAYKAIASRSSDYIGFRQAKVLHIDTKTWSLSVVEGTFTDLVGRHVKGCWGQGAGYVYSVAWVVDL